MSLTATRYCDLVMKGGITSGVVYPNAVLASARDFRFKNIGGTSAGAIARAKEIQSTTSMSPIQRVVRGPGMLAVVMLFITNGARWAASDRNTGPSRPV